MNKKAALKRLNERLTESAKLLDKAAMEVRDLKLNSKYNIRKIGEALANIFEIQMQIYKQQPNLRPDYLKKVKS